MAMAGSLLLSAAAILLLSAALRLRQGFIPFVAERAINQRFRAYFMQDVRTRSLHGALASFFSSLGARFTQDDSLKTLRAQLSRAGIYGPGAAYIFSGIQIAGAVSAAAIAVILLKPVGASPDAKSLAAGCFAGFGFYRLLHAGLYLRAQARLRDIRRELPYVLDLVLMVLEAGVSIDMVLQHISGQLGRAAPITGGLLKQYLAEVEEGLPYDQALDRLAGRLAIEEGRDFTNLLKLNLFQGGELGPPLRRLAADIGETRLSLAREQIGRKSVLLTLTMLGFFMPVLMIALAGPAVHDVMTTLQNVARDLQAGRI